MTENYRSFDWSLLRADANQVYPSPSAFYGPYTDIQTAHSAIYGALTTHTPAGLKFGVKNTETGELIEYQYGRTPNNVEDLDAIERIATTDYVDTKVDEINETTGDIQDEITEMKSNVAFIRDSEDSGESADFDPYSDTVWNKPQTLSSTQKTQVRANIGAVSSEEVARQINATVSKADEEDITSDENNLLKLKNRDNYVILRSNKTFASQVTNANTIYEIRYDFTLDSDVTMPANCVLKFEGGSISGNKTLTGNNTGINAENVPIFGNDIDIAGSWLVPDIYSNWFVDATQNNILKKVLKLISSNIHNNIYIADGIYQLSALTDTRETVLMLDAPNTDVYCSGSLNLAPNGFYGYNIVTISADNVNWHGGFIIGDAKYHDYSTHQGDGYKTHEHGFGIALTGSNCAIEDVNISLCTGDGICVKGDSVSNRIIGATISKCRRQGITVADTKNLIINNFDINNIGDFVYEDVSITGTLPKSAIDIEPDTNNSAAENITIKNGIITDCGYGIVSTRADNVTKNSNLYIENIIISSSQASITIAKSRNVSINNIISNRSFEFNGVELLHTNKSRFTSIGLYNSNNAIKFSSSIFTDLYINNSSVSIDNCEFNLFSSISNDVNIVLDNCKVVTTSGTIINGNFSNPFKLVAKNTIFEKDVEGGTVGVMYIGDNADFKFEDCSFYTKSGTEAVQFRAGHSVKSIIFINCECYLYQNEEYVLHNEALTNIVAPSIIFEKSEYLYGSTRPLLSSRSKGHVFFDTSLSPAKPIYCTGSAWVDATGVIAGTPTSGTFANKPTVSSNSIPIGFKYFCTDKQTTEGATDGIEIIHKGNDVWVDALGRVVS